MQPHFGENREGKDRDSFGRVKIANIVNTCLTKEALMGRLIMANQERMQRVYCRSQMHYSHSAGPLTVVSQRHLKRCFCLLILALFVTSPSVCTTLSSSQSAGGPFVEYTLFLSNGTLVNGNVQSTATVVAHANSQWSSAVSNNEELSTATTTVSVGGVPNGIAFDALNDDLYVANFSPGTLSVINGTDNSIVTTVNLNDPVSPWYVGFNPSNGNIYVSDTKNGAVSVINGGTNSVTATVAVGDDMLSGDHDDRPNGVAYNPNNQNMYVAMYGSGYIAEIDSSRNVLMANAPIGVDPYVNSGLWGLTYDPLNCNLYSSNVNTNTVTIVNGVTNLFVSMVNVGRDPNGVAVDTVPGSSYGNVFVANYAANTVSVISGASSKVIATINVGQNPDGIALDTATGDLYVTNYGDGTVSVIDGATNSVVSTLQVGSGPSGVAYNPVNGDIYVSDSNTATVSIIFTGSVQSESTSQNAISSCSVADSSSGSISATSTETTISSTTSFTSQTSATLSYSVSNEDSSSFSQVTTTNSLSTTNSTAPHLSANSDPLQRFLPLMIAVPIVAAISLFAIRRHSKSAI